MGRPALAVAVAGVLHSAGSPRPPFTDRHLVPFLPPAPLHSPAGWPLRAACGASACLSGSALPLFEHRPPLVRLPFCSASGLQFFFSRNPAASPLALETALGGCGPCVFPTAAVTSTTRWFRQTDRRLFSYSSGGEKPAVHLVGLTSRCRRAGWSFRRLEGRISPLLLSASGGCQQHPLACGCVT